VRITSRQPGLAEDRAGQFEAVALEQADVDLLRPDIDDTEVAAHGPGHHRVPERGLEGAGDQHRDPPGAPDARGLRQDERVRVHDRTNIRELDLTLIDGPVDLVVGDLSFISLELVLDPLIAVTRPGSAPWSDEEEATLAAIADQSAAPIEIARLTEEVRQARLIAENTRLSEAEREARTALEAERARLATVLDNIPVAVVLAEAISDALTPGSPLSLPPRETLSRMRTADFARLFRPAMLTAPLEVTIVGDVTAEERDQAVAGVVAGAAEAQGRGPQLITPAPARRELRRRPYRSFRANPPARSA